MTAVRNSSNISVEDGTAIVKGWVQEVRALGGIAFVTLRDRYGTIQITMPKKKIDPALFEELTKVPRESVVAVTGEVKASNQTALGLEIIPSAVEIYSRAAAPLPLGVVDKVDAGMDTRLDHRFMDVRKPEIKAVFELKAMMVELIEECVRE
ncbi:MAG: OB-fold nucleic acid binding domain-containing protein, partial [archaeon]|nr:OB-fold nucleic acid binding domain-containing protein [archaeon]